MKPKPKYSWDNDKGVTRNDKQVLQLMDLGQPVFRKHCGKILVEALNGEEAKIGDGGERKYDTPRRD